MKTKARDTELFAVVTDVMGKVSGRPTRRPSDSSDGPKATEPSSEDASFLRVIRQEEDSGRPDRALMVLQAQEASRSAV